MIFKIAWMYYDLLELYGDKGNLRVIEYILNKNQIEYQIDKITINEVDKDISNYDFVFLGGGSDQNQLIIEEDLKLRKKQFKNVLENNGFILTICGGYQFFGEYYLDAHNNKMEGLGIFDYYTQAGSKRCIGNIKEITNFELDGKKMEIVGFENHSGETKNIKPEDSFSKIIKGHGNEYGGQYEGFKTNNFIGTYVHGPLLPKNPLLAKYIIQKVLEQKYKIQKNIEIDFLEETKLAKNEVKY